MKGKILYIASILVIAIPWLFLLELLPISYSQITTAAEVTSECIMFAALFAIVIFLKKDMKRLREIGQEGRAGRTIERILFVLASLTLFVVGLVLVLIAISFSV